MTKRYAVVECDSGPNDHVILRGPGDVPDLSEHTEVERTIRALQRHPLESIELGHSLRIWDREAQDFLYDANAGNLFQRFNR
jgi:hypothetical protein